jgi:hypothetical protein
MEAIKKIRIFITVIALVMIAVGFGYSKMQERGTVPCEVGREYKTRWFSFTVESISRVEKYADYEPDEGFALIDVLISEKCTFQGTTVMSTSDFYLDSEEFEEYVWPIDAIDGTMMPEEFEMKRDDSAQYHMVYEVPGEAENLSLVYEETDEKGKVYRTFVFDIK